MFTTRGASLSYFTLPFRLRFHDAHIFTALYSPMLHQHWESIVDVHQQSSLIILSNNLGVNQTPFFQSPSFLSSFEVVEW